MNREEQSGRDSQPNKTNHPNWELFAIGSVVAVSFAALFIAGYVIWAKCHGQ